MRKFQAMNNYFAIFLVLFSCHGFLLTHAREIKPLTQHSLLNKATVVREDRDHPLKSSVNNIPPPSLENKYDSTVMTKYGVSSFGNSGAAYTNAFQPTTPGSSPGVGHRKFAQEYKDMKAKLVVHSPGVKLYMTEETNGFKPTTPGHSPGVGHSQQN